MANKIQFRRGLKANLPALSVAEPAFTTDTHDLYIGSSSGNIQYAKKSEIKENVYINVKDYGAKGNGVADDTGAINEALSHTGCIFFPAGTYNITSTIQLPDKPVKMLGENWLSTILKLTTDNIPLIQGHENDSNGIQYATFSELTLQGNGSGNRQTGFDLKGYMYEIYHCRVTKFNTATKLSGVFVRLTNSYIDNNITGCLLQKIADGTQTASIATVVRIVNTEFMLNSGTCITDDNGASGRLTVINLLIDGCGFEQSGKPLDLRNHQNCTITQCWFEANINKSDIVKLNLVLSNNRFEANQSFNYVELPGVYPFGTGGISEENGNGIASYKEVHYQLYDNATLTDNGKVVTTEKVLGTKHVIDVFDGVDHALVAKVGTSADGIAYDTTYHIAIKQDGTVKHDLPFSVTITKSTGVYSISFGSTIENPVISVVCANQSGTDFEKLIIPIVSAKNTLDAAGYQNYGGINLIRVKCIDLGSANTPTDAKVYITIVPMRY